MATVLHITSGLGVGGAETMLIQLASRLQRAGHPQHVISLSDHNELAPVLEQKGIDVTRLKIQSVWGGLAAILQMRAIISKISPDVIQGWMYHGNLAATLAYLLAGRQRVRLYWGLRASNVDDERYRRIIQWNALLSGLPYMVIANSVAGAGFHKNRGFHPRRMEVVANGIDTDRFRPDIEARAAFRATLGFRPDDIVLIHVARVDPMKAHDVFLSAMKKVPNLKAVLVGTGTEGLQVPPNVLALGARFDVEKLYPGADIVVSSSAFGEGFSNAIAEGMSAGLVPVATNVGDATRIIDGVGVVVPPNNPDALAFAMREVAGLPLEMLRARGLAARNRIVQEFGIARAVEDFTRLYLGS